MWADLDWESSTACFEICSARVFLLQYYLLPLLKLGERREFVAMIHAHYKGLATKAEAEKWFNVRPA
jgi:hypothetical protein